jgi:SARP family transcriptional regulator, regulator of embCAB operon
MPAAPPAALTVLVSKLRATIGPEVLRGRGDVRLALPANTRVGVEDALAGVHAAESAVALGDWKPA